MKLKLQVAITLVTNALLDKSVNTGVKAYINTCRPSSTDDLCVLLKRIRNGKDALCKAYKDNRGFWHFFTTA